VGSSKSQNPIGLHDLLRGYLYFLLLIYIPIVHNNRNVKQLGNILKWNTIIGVFWWIGRSGERKEWEDVICGSTGR
jgi:hypothetical protein